MYHILKNKVRCEGTRQLQKLTTGALLVTVHLQNQVKNLIKLLSSLITFVLKASLELCKELNKQ